MLISLSLNIVKKVHKSQTCISEIQKKKKKKKKKTLFDKGEL